MNNKTQYHGSCLCQKIQFTVSAVMPHQAHCHCRSCQKFHGAAFSTFAEVNKNDFNLISGDSLLTFYQSENQSKRYFCRHCGASLFFESVYNIKDNTIEVALAAFDELPDVKPDAHIFTESKASWITIKDTLPKFERYRQ